MLGFIILKYESILRPYGDYCGCSEMFEQFIGLGGLG